MAKIRVSTPDNTPQGFEGESGIAVRRYHPGSEKELQMFEVALEPDAVIGRHAHMEDEIIYVAEGELVLGRQVLTTGSSVYIQGQTLYTFRAGPNGLRFLNFRARRDPSYFMNDEWRSISG